MTQTVYAYTPEGAQPPYINVSSLDDDTLNVTVRGSVAEDDSQQTGVINIPADQVDVLIDALKEYRDSTTQEDEQDLADVGEATEIAHGTPASDDANDAA